MAGWDCKRDVAPFIAMALAECTTVCLHTLYKAANSKGLNYFVFMTYSYVLGTLVLLPFCYIFSRRGLTSFKLPVIYNMALLSLLGFLARVFGYKGLEYSSPFLSSAISTLAPAFTFILALVFRMEDVDVRRSSTQAKIIGTIISVSGAMGAVLYKGPTLLSSQSGSVLYHAQPPPTSQTNWVFGGFLLAAEQLCNSSTYILTAQILRMYPSELIVAFVYCFGVTIIAAPVSFMVKSDLSAWILSPDIRLIVVVYSAFLGQVFILTMHTCCLPLKGPLYISIFKPISIVIAAAASVIFLGDALYLGSVVGAIILLLGFYAVLWGKAKEQKSKEYDSKNLGASTDAHTPLFAKSG